MNKDLLKLQSLTAKEIQDIIKRGLFFKKNKNKTFSMLKGKILGLIFEKSSTRTRVSFEAAMARLGGTSIYMEKQNTQIARGETYADTARVLSRYVDVLVFRAYAQKDLEELAENAPLPVINGLTDLFHPCQVLADLMTLVEKKGRIDKLSVAWVGDGNNMARTWVEAAMLLGFGLNVACPASFGLDKELISEAKHFKNIYFTDNPKKAVTNVDAINVDTWFSMGQKVSDKKRRLFEPFQLNQKLLSLAHPQALVLHCLPAHRGEEITDDVMDGPQSVIFDEAENRLHVQMALLEKFVLKKKS